MGGAAASSGIDGAAAREALAVQLQTAEGHLEIGLGPCCAPVAATCGDEGLPLLAMGCKNQVHILSVLDGESDMEIVCCLEPRAGLVLALDWSKRGHRLACICEKEVLVISPQQSPDGSRSGKSDFSQISRALADGTEWFITHRVASTQHSSISWGMLGGETIILTGGSIGVAWRMAPGRRQADGVSTLTRVDQGTKSGATGKEASPGSEPSDWCLRGSAGHHQIAMSPDSAWIASCPAFGRVVTLRHAPTPRAASVPDNLIGVGRTVMLPHPRSVLTIGWLLRLQRQGWQGASDTANVLLTCCSDGVARVWKELRVVDGRGDWSQTTPLRSSGRASGKPGLGGGTFVLCYSVGRDLLSQAGITAESVFAASWVINVVPGYETAGRESTMGDKQDPCDGADGQSGNEAEETSAEENVLLATVTGTAVCIWSLAGLTNGLREGTRVSCVNRSDLVQHATLPGRSFVDVKIFHSAVSPGFSMARGGRKRLLTIMTDARGLVTGGSLVVGSQVASESRPMATFDSPLAISTAHVAPCRFLGEGHSELSVAADDLGILSFWWWDTSCIGRASRHQLIMAGSLQVEDGISAAASDGFKLLVSSEGNNMLRFMELSTFNPTGGAPRVETQEEIIMSRSGTETFKSLQILRMTRHEWFCAVGTTGDLGALWCGGVSMRRKADTALNEDSDYTMEAAFIPSKISQVTCAHVPDCRATRDFRHSQKQDDEKGDALGFFFVGDREGFLHLSCARFGRECGRASGSVDILSSFGDASLGVVLHIQAQALGCVASVHSVDPHGVHIWRTSAVCNSFCKVGHVSIPGISSILSLSWVEPVPLFPILAVATESTVYVVMRTAQPDSARAPTSEWAIRTSEWAIRWGTSVSCCSSITWTSDCRILAMCAGGIFALDPALKNKHIGFSIKPSALSSHAGYSLSPLLRPIPGTASGLQVLHENLQDILSRHPPLSPKILHLHWNAGHVAVLHRIIRQIFDVVNDEGTQARIGMSEVSETFNLMMGFNPKDQKKGDVDTASVLADQGFGSSFSGGLDNYRQDGGGTQGLCKSLVDMMDKSTQEGESINEVLSSLKPTLTALNAALSGLADRLDEPAQRFTFALLLHDSTEKEAVAKRAASGNESQKAEVLRSGMMSMANMAWAMLSGEQDTLIRNFLPEQVSWEDIRFVGAPLWISSPSSLKAMADRLSKAQFKKDRDPTECALLYLCLDKKSTLTAMFKMVKNDVLHNFFLRDFSQDQHKAAAVKNAYTLLSQHRYKLAAAFFLLADQFEDAFQTILNKMNDPMLALLVARLQSKSDSGPIYEKAMLDILFKFREEGENLGASLANWKLGRFSEALACLAGGSVTDKARNQHNVFDLFQVVSLYTWMRNDPRVRLSAGTCGVVDATPANMACEIQVSALISERDDSVQRHDEQQSASGQSQGTRFSVVDMLKAEISLRQSVTWELTGEGLIDFALEQCKMIGDIKTRISLEMEGFSVGNMTAISSVGRAKDAYCSKEARPIDSESIGRASFEHQLFMDLTCAITERSVRAALPLTPDYVHPATLQDLDPAKTVSAFLTLSDTLSKCGMEITPFALIGSALHECAVLNRLDCYTSLSLSAGTASEGFAFLTVSSLAIPEAMKSLPSISRKPAASSYFLRLARRFTNAGTVMAEASGQPPWLGDCLHLDALHRRVCLATFFCAFMSFWHSYDTAGLQLLLCGMWDERASKSCDSAMALSSYAQRALTRLSSLHRCEWAKVWARYEKQISSLQASCGKIFESQYFGYSEGHAHEELNVRMLDLLVLERMASLLCTAASFGRSDDDVCSMVSVASEAIRVSKERMTLIVHELTNKMKFDTLASVVQPYLGPNLMPPSDPPEDAEVGHLRKQLLVCDDRARMDMHKASLAILAHSPTHLTLQSGKLRLGRVEVLLTQKGEVLRSLCAHSDDRSGTVLSVCSNKSIREVHCRPDAVSVVGAGHEGLAAVLSSSSAAPLKNQQESGSSQQQINRASVDQAVYESEVHSTHQNSASMLTAVDGVLEMLWDKVSTSAAEVVHSVADVGSQGSNPSGVGAMALAAHPWLPVFVSGGPDGAVLLWGFGAPQPLSAFGSMSSGLVNRMRFDDPGAKFCGCDGTGLAAVWNFELARGAGLDRRPVDLIQAHSKRCYDICFLDKGTLLGTAGSGSSSSVCVWDLLMPPSSACAAALNLHDHAANSLCHFQGKHLLISGGHKGDICVTDTRTWRCLRTIHNAHKLATRSLCLSPAGNLIVSGSTDGDIKFWDVEDLVIGAGDASPVTTWSGAHEKVSNEHNLYVIGFNAVAYLYRSVEKFAQTHCIHTLMYTMRIQCVVC